ncbi:MAG: hypothetical protein WBJ34_11965, partial [Syntrophomonadaceae bacterium]
TEANFLVLDEPTNHRDMESRLVVEDMLSQFEGTMLIVSHDRALIDSLATRVLVFEEHALVSYTGNYSDYKEAKLRQHEVKDTENKPKSITEQQAYRQRQKELQRNLNRLNREKAEAEANLEELEKRLEKVEKELADPKVFADAEAVASLGKEHQEPMEKYEQVFYHWEQLNQRWEEATQESE